MLSSTKLLVIGLIAIVLVDQIDPTQANFISDGLHHFANMLSGIPLLGGIIGGIVNFIFPTPPPEADHCQDYAFLHQCDDQPISRICVSTAKGEGMMDSPCHLKVYKKCKDASAKQITCEDNTIPPMTEPYDDDGYTYGSHDDPDTWTPYPDYDEIPTWEPEETEPPLGAPFPGTYEPSSSPSHTPHPTPRPTPRPTPSHTAPHTPTPGSSCGSELDCDASYAPVCDTEGFLYDNMCLFDIVKCRNPSIEHDPNEECLGSVGIDPDSSAPSLALFSTAFTFAAATYFAFYGL